MHHANVTVHQNPASLREYLQSENTLWLGALSFESRCTGTLEAIQHANLQLSRGVALDYSTNVYPSTEDRELREGNWDRLRSVATGACKDNFDKIRIEPYSFSSMQQAFKELIISSRVEFVLLDITCMTKIHALATAAALAQPELLLKWAVAYSIPENYGNLG